MNDITEQTNNDITLYGLIKLFIQQWLILVIFGLSFAVIAAIWSLYQPNVYTAEITIMPVKKDEKSMAGMANQLGGLASLAGINLNKGLDENAKLALKLLTSKSFLMEFIEEEELLIPLMAVNGWNMEEDSLKINEDIYDAEKGMWLRSPNPPRKAKPSSQEAYTKLKELIDIEEEPKTKFITISFDFYSPKLATKWVTKLVEKVNRDIRLLDQKMANESIEYLQTAYTTANLSNMKKAISVLVEEQLQTKMLTEVRKDYVFMTVDPAIEPELKSKPKRAIIVVFAGFLGGVLGMIVILILAGRKSPRPS